MRKVFVLEDLDCAHCALKMEKAIQKINGVKFASINFMASKLTLEAEDSIFASVLIEAQKQIKKVEPDCKIKM